MFKHLTCHQRAIIGTMPHIFAFANQKGGVGKTTSAYALGAAVGERGKRVLLVDLDPQGGLTTSCGLVPETLENTIYRAFSESAELQSLIHPTKVPNVALIPSNLDLAGAEADLIGQVAWEQTLKDALTPVLHEYDVILVDCPPSLGVLTTNALIAASTVIIPLQCEFLALRALKQLQAIITKLRRRANPHLEVRILRTLYDGRTVHSREVFEEIGQVAANEVLKTYIKRTIRFADAAAAGEPIILYDKDSEAAGAYRELAKELNLTGRMAKH
jgi:chromosome partitioning protein